MTKKQKTILKRLIKQNGDCSYIECEECPLLTSNIKKMIPVCKDYTCIYHRFEGSVEEWRMKHINKIFKKEQLKTIQAIEKL